MPLLTSLSDATCGEPDTLPDADIVQPADQSTSASGNYNVGDTVIYNCRTGDETLQRTCLSDGDWSPAGYVCTGMLQCSSCFSALHQNRHVSVSVLLPFLTSFALLILFQGFQSAFVFYHSLLLNFFFFIVFFMWVLRSPVCVSYCFIFVLSVSLSVLLPYSLPL